jgi:hypothetical protein
MFAKAKPYAFANDFRFANISKGSPRTFAALAHHRWSKPRALMERISGVNNDVSDCRWTMTMLPL